MVETELNQPLGEGGIIDDCREHHNDTGEPKKTSSDHNVFDLQSPNREGYAVVASRVVGGHFSVPVED